MRRSLPVVIVLLTPLIVLAAQQAAYVPLPVTSSETAILLRGECTLSEGVGTVALPEWFENEAKAAGRVVFVSARCENAVWASEVSKGSFEIRTDANAKPDLDVTWLVVAARK